jgi:hypothetical protein
VSQSANCVHAALPISTSLAGSDAMSKAGVAKSLVMNPTQP